MSKRKIEETSESVKDTINKNVPESKFQGEQQVVDSANVKSDAGASSFIPKKKEIKGTQLKQDTVSEIIRSGAAGGGNLGDGSTFAGRPVSGEGSAVVSAASQTPRADQRRSDSRLGKKLDRNSTKLNFIPNDQVLVEFTESKPLAEASDLDQGYNGTYRSENARMQKASGAVPGDLMFDRDIQLITRDELYFGQGQQIHSASGVDAGDAVTATVAGVDSRNGNPTYGPYSVRQNGNFLTTEAHITMNADGSVDTMYFTEHDFTEPVSDTVANKSSVARTVLRNDAEIVREKIDSKAGDEKADIWCPLARAVSQPTATVGLLRDIEAEVGNELITAYRKASSSFAYQLNRAHLDGQDLQSPAIEYMRGLRTNYVSKDYMDGADQFGRDIRRALFPDTNSAGRTFYSSAPASLMVALYDSTTKYTSKADFLVQPRGLRMHLQTADNNLNAFHADRALIQAFTARETFSSIDHAYDGTLPVCMTDKAGVIHKLSWNDLAAFTHGYKVFTAETAGSNLADDVVILNANQASALAGTCVNVYFPKESAGVNLQDDDISLLDGKITVKAAATNSVPFRIVVNEAEVDPAAEDEYYVLSIPVQANVPVILAKTNVNKVANDGNFVRMYRDHCGPYKYAYSDLRNNYFVDVPHYLFSGIERYLEESIGSRLYGFLPESDRTLHIKTVHSTQYASFWSFMLCAATPFIQKERINAMRDVLYYEKNVEYPFSTTLVPVGEATTKQYTNFVFSDYDHELGVGTMQPSVAVTWILPEMYQRLKVFDNDQLDVTKLLCPWYSNEEDGHFTDEALRDDAAMSYPSTRSGVRLSLLDTIYGMSEKDVRLCCDIVSSFAGLSNRSEDAFAYKYGITTDGQVVVADPSSNVLTAHDMISLPRNIGRYCVAPYGVLTPTYNNVYISPTDDQTDLAGTSSYAIKFWVGTALNPHDTVDGDDSINTGVSMAISRASNFVQKWYAILSTGDVPREDAGFVCSLNALGDDVLGMGVFNPIVTNGNARYTGDVTTFRTLQKAMWTRVQKLPFALSPFDFVHQSLITASANVIADPYDMLYWFGLAGFRASDYRESVYNREKEVINQGMLFVKDPWMAESPIFREGSVASSVFSDNSF